MTLTIALRAFRVPEGAMLDLKKWPTHVRRAYESKKAYHKLLDEQVDALTSLQQLHYVRIIKIFLHESKDIQRKGSINRIDDPDKNWQLSVADVEERGLWKRYMQAYEACFRKTSTGITPWCVVSADDKQNARLIISKIILDAFKGLKMAYPKPGAKRRRELQWNSARVRRDATCALRFAGLEPADDADAPSNADHDAAAPASRVRALVVRAREDLAILKNVLHLRHADLSRSDCNCAAGGIPKPRAPHATVAGREASDVRVSIARWENEGGAPHPAQSSGELGAMKKLIVFDLDGTLAESKAPVDAEMAALLGALLRVVKVAVISGGGWPQFKIQLLSRLSDDERLTELSLLPTCGTQFFQYTSDWTLLYAENFFSEEKELIVHSLKVALESSDLQIATTWGEQIEDRGSQITFSALGQQAPIEEKKKWDPDFAKRKKLQACLEQLIPEFSVRLGGTTSVDVTTLGIDKGYGMRKLRSTLGIGLHEMLFIGDALFPGGNDYPAKEAGVESIQVRDPDETKRVIEAILACGGRVRHTRVRESAPR